MLAFLLENKETLEKEIRSLETYLSIAPEGTLVSRQSGADKYNYSYYIRDQNGQKKEFHIPVSDREFATKLAYSAYVRNRLADCKKELHCLNEFLKLYGDERKADHYLKTHPGAARLILSHIHGEDSYAQKWLQQPYVRSNRHPEQLIYPTVNPDLKVRSKAESDIISRLVNYHVPYRYEEQVIIHDVVMHPDFTCLNIRTRREYYWEHQGAWDKASYVGKLAGREEQYRIAGIIPWKNLIITTETGNQPLDINWVDKIIQYFLL